MNGEDVVKLVMIGCMAAVGTFAGVMSYIDKNFVKYNYNGVIGGHKINYTERGRYCNELKSLVVNDGNTQYTLTDYLDSKNITDPNFAGQSLEKVVIQTGDHKEVFDKRVKEDSLKEQYKSQVFERANKLYNETRAQIRHEIEVGYQTRINNMPQ